MRLGPVVQDALLRIPPAMMRHWGWLSWMLCSRCRQWAAGAGCRGCFAPDAASYDKILGPVFQDALLRMQYRQWAYRIKRIVTGAGVCGCFAPDTASDIGSYRIIIGADVPGCLAPETANNYRDR